MAGTYSYQSKFKGSEVDDRLDGIPPGGTTDQVLTKKSDDDFNTEWADPQGGSEGYLTFTPQTASSVPNLTLFVDQADNVLKFKASNGTVYEVGLAATS